MTQYDTEDTQINMINSPVVLETSLATETYYNAVACSNNATLTKKVTNVVNSNTDSAIKNR